MTLPEVIQGTGVGYFVASKSTPGAFYCVHTDDENALACTCPAVVRCRHMRLAAEFWAEQDRRHARPPMPTNVSALCD